MKRNAFTIWAIISVIIFQQSILARVAARPALRKSSQASMLPFAGSVAADAKHDARILRVTDGQDANIASVSVAEGSSFNADASRFIVNLDGLATVYNFDPATLGIKKQGPLFDVAGIASDAVRWSASEANTLYVMDTRDGATNIGSYDLQTRSITIVKDFASVLGAGEAHGFSKSAGDDDRFAFAWRAAGSAEWQAVVVWDRTSDNLYTFNLQDGASGVAGFKDARLNLSGEALIINGDATRVWRFASQPQSEATVVAGENKAGDSVQMMSAAGNQSSNQLRQNVSRDGRFSIFNSNLDGARQDVYIATINPAATANVEWTHMVNCSADSNSLQKTGGNDSADDARATSTQSITAGDGYVEFTAAEVDKERWCGLNNATMLHESAMDINFAIKMAPKKKATIIEDGKTVLKLGKYKAKNVFRIAVESGVVNYYLKGNLIYTSAARPMYPLMVNASLVNSMATVKNVMINGATIIPVVSISPHKASIFTSQSMQFLSQVTGVVNTGVTWSANGGSISASGMYTAPATVGEYTVKAISAADANVFATATVSVVNGGDTTPPVISAVASSGVTTSGATITWTTNEPADTQVEYGTTTAYGNSTTLNSSMVTSHSAGLSGLAANTTYHYRAKSKDAAGNPAVSADATFRTAQGADTTPPTISSVAVTGVSTNGATVSWTTNEAADTQVDYGTTTNYGSSTTLNTSMVTSHSATLSSLAAGTTYHFRVKSKDAAGNLATSGDQSFATTSSGGGGGGGTVITDKNVHPEPAPPALPPAGGTFVDPVFRTTILRVTDSGDGSSNGTSYSYYPTFNSNSTRLVVYNGSSSSLYDFDPVGFRVSNKRRLFQAALPTGGFPGSEDATWSNVNPDIMYCHAHMRIYAYNVVSNTYTVVKDFTGIVPGSEIWQMSRSADDNAFGFHVKDANYSVIGYAAYQRSQNIVYQQSTTDVNEVEIDKTGQFLYVSTETGGYQSAIEGRIWNLQTRQFTDLTDGAPDYAPGHKDVGRGSVIGADNWRNTYTYRPLSNGHQVTTVIDFGNDWSQATHLSMLGDDDGWALVSMYVSNTLPNSGLYRNEILQVATDGSQRVRRLAHHHSTYRDYYDTPRANISKDGRFVAFTSNWGSTTRRDMFIIKVPTGTGGGGGGGGDTTAPVISGVSSSGVTTSGATVNWTTNEASDSQVDYGTTASYGSSTSLNSTLVTGHSAGLAGLAAGTTYHYRVRSRDAAGNLAASGDQTFTTTGSGGGGGGGGGGGTGRQNVVWVGVTNCASNGGTLQKNGGFDGTPDAGARSQQALTGSGYLEFTTVETNKLRFCGLTHSVSGTDYAAIDFAIKPLTNGYVEVRENNVYKADTPYQNGDVFRIAVENGVVKYYKNGTVFYTSSTAPSFPLVADASLLSSSSTISNAGMAATSGALATVYVPESTMPMGAALLAVNDVREGLTTIVNDVTGMFDLLAALTNDPLGRKARRFDWF